MKCFWHESDNFGDKLTPYILGKLGVPYTYTPKGISEEHYIMCGSILPACNKHSIIWGAGIAQSQQIEKPKQILAVRGKLTRQYLLQLGIYCPEVYGDPAMILPYIYNPKVEKQRKIGIIPHMVDYKPNRGDTWDLKRPVEETIDYILSCERIISASLHALITANAYDIEWEFIPSPNVIGGNFKFADFFQTEYDIDKFISVAPFKIPV